MADGERSAHVVVGYDGSDHANAAVEWGAVEAVRRGVPLRLVHALGMPLIVSAYGGPVRFEPTDEIRGHATKVLAVAAERARTAAPSVAVETVTTLEDPPLALLRQSHPGDLIVVGTRGLGGVASMVVGSVSVRVATQAPCPVVVVPTSDGGKPPTTALDKIVVGVDGGANSRRALGLAMNLAEESGGEVVVVHSWEIPFAYDPVALTASGWQPQEELFEEQSEKLVAELLADVVDQRREDSEVTVSVVRSKARPSEALLEAATGADAIVVGSRGRGSVRGLLLGSVSQTVLHHSPIPVVVLPRHADEEDE
ncbi:universal stress protein [Nocardiopsis sp. YSL2]|uniref:universal stress protein n=1 Tax=Nocardiopsis sp. YSL2 TaxID=2939492 RepID=UPI0026F4695D|nr:universal stress protein [Nocardiopsis sp. YSL2]